MNLADLFFQRSLLHPQRLALHVAGRSYSYLELAALSCHVAEWVQARGRVERVGILASRSLSAYAGLLGSCWAGKPFIYLAPSQPNAMLEAQLRLVRPQALIVDGLGYRRLRRLSSDLRPRHVLDPQAEGGVVALCPGPGIRTPVCVDPRTIAFIMFTSGTTGEPKGAAVTVAGEAHYLRSMSRCYRLAPSDRLSQFFQMNIDLCLFDLFMALNSGGSSFVVPESERMCPDSFIRRHSLTVWSSVPSVIHCLRQLDLLKPGRFRHLRLSLFCGEALSESAARAWKAAAPRARIENLYGTTEIAGTCLRQVYRDSSKLGHGRGIVPLGKPTAGMRALLWDIDGRPVKGGKPGELVISGPQLAAGYWQAPAYSRHRFIRSSGRGKPIRWYRTGDRCFQDRRGVFHYLGRIDRQIKILGHRVEPETVEAELKSLCRVNRVAVIAWPRQDGIAQGLKAFVAGRRLEPGWIKRSLAKRLPHYLVPRQIVLLPKLPSTANGKIDYRALERISGR